MRRRHRQKGLAVVEFSIVGLLTLVLLFGTMEFSRLLYTWNALTDATRRGARLAAVCPPYDPAITRVTLWQRPNGDDQGLGFPGLAAGNVVIRYFDSLGLEVTPAAGDLPSLQAVQFVQVAIEGYELPLFIPAISPTISMPPFQTTLPSESLGLVPPPNSIDCQAV